MPDFQQAVKIGIQIQNGVIMFKNYLKITLRNLVKHRVHSTINVLGLSVGIAVSLLMLLFAWNTLTYDQFHKNADDIYFLYRLRPSPEGTLTVYDTWVPTVPEMQKDFPEIIRGYRSFSMGQWVHHCLLYTSPSPRDPE